MRLCLPLLLALGLQGNSGVAALLSVLAAPNSSGLNYTVYITATAATNSDGTMAGPDLSGGLIQITSGQSKIPFTLFLQNPTFAFWGFQASVPANVLSQPYSLAWSNFTTNVMVGGPWFTLQPQPRSAWAGNVVTFAAQAVHTTGFSWQKNGTNLLNNGHFSGVTNSSLVISNAQPVDDGVYMAVTTDATNPATSNGAQLWVFKPVTLKLTKNSPAAVSLWVANQDGSAFESNRVANLVISSSSDFAIWQNVTEAGMLTNGIVQYAYPFYGKSNCVWRVLETPP